jgi:hypothetical protein
MRRPGRLQRSGAWKRKRKQELAWAKVRDKHYDDETNYEIEHY